MSGLANSCTDAINTYEIVSPGGFPAGITPENILWQQNPRNRRIAEVLGKCGLVERAGQGVLS